MDIFYFVLIGTRKIKRNIDTNSNDYNLISNVDEEYITIDNIDDDDADPGERALQTWMMSRKKPVIYRGRSLGMHKRKLKLPTQTRICIN